MFRTILTELSLVHYLKAAKVQFCFYDILRVTWHLTISWWYICFLVCFYACFIMFCQGYASLCFLKIWCLHVEDFSFVCEKLSVMIFSLCTLIFKDKQTRWNGVLLTVNRLSVIVCLTHHFCGFSTRTSNVHELCKIFWPSVKHRSKALPSCRS